MSFSSTETSIMEPSTTIRTHDNDTPNTFSVYWSKVSRVYDESLLGCKFVLLICITMEVRDPRNKGSHSTLKTFFTYSSDVFLISCFISPPNWWVGHCVVHKHF